MKRKIRMHMCPRVLVLHIKRFLFDRADKIALKRKDSIAISATLDISRFCEELKFCSPELAAASPTYKLRSFLNHIGEANVGHYISYSRTNDDIWFVFFAPRWKCLVQASPKRYSCLRNHNGRCPSCCPTRVYLLLRGIIY